MTKNNKNCRCKIVFNALCDDLEDISSKQKDIVIVSNLNCITDKLPRCQTHSFMTIPGHEAATALGIKVSRDDLMVIVLACEKDIIEDGLYEFIYSISQKKNITYLIITTNSDETIDISMLTKQKSCHYVKTIYFSNKESFSSTIKAAIQYNGTSIVRIIT